jgi:murein endopeptidase
LRTSPSKTRFGSAAQAGAALLLGALAVLVCASPEARAWDRNLPDMPVSEFLDSLDGGNDVGFCAEWNPDFGYKGLHCCPKAPMARRGRRAACAPHRKKVTYCDELTEEQRRNRDLVSNGQAGDLLERIATDLARSREQSFCSVSNGFLAWGREVLPSPVNRIQVRAPHRCVSFGTDGMVGMLEWVGRKVNEEYSKPEFSKTHLLIGDISAPRGGCLSGRGGRRGHASHTSGQDVDLGFLVAKPNRASPDNLSKDFDPRTNWWLIKQVFSNPYACVKVVFLDKRLIAKLAKVASDDPEWKRLRSHIHHVKGHRNHFHIRVGTQPGHPGCPVDQTPEEDALPGAEEEA